MKTKALFVIILLMNFAVMKGQVITCNPAFPLASDEVVVTFNADQGNAGLKDYIGDIYAHTGVITDKSATSSEWKYVVAAWETNTSKAKMTRVSANVYTLTLTPSIREYYGVPAGEEILKMTFVFRNSDGTKTGKTAANGDIFYDVSETPVFNIALTLPDEYNTLVNEGDEIQVAASASVCDSLILLDNNVRLIKVTGLSADYTITASGSGLHKIVARAWNDNVRLEDSVFYYISTPVIVENPPSGLKPGVNVISPDAAAFLLYAPGKDNVFVTGDFNDWLFCDEGAMKKSSDGNWFWLEVPGLDPAVEYGFQYVIDGTIYIPDPYTTKILDPDNDKGIPSATYPNLKEYPTELAKGLVSVFQTQPTQYIWDNTSFTPPSGEDLVIYELLVRDFTAAHDFNTIRDTLSYLSRLGVNAIEFMPVFEFEGNSSWGYNPSMYFAVDKYYGPANSFKELIDSCHNRGIAVIMDMVLNHAYGSNPLVKMYYDGSTYKVTSDNPWFNVNSPNQAYSWGYDFNHESVATQAFVDSVNHYWLDEFKIDGFRYDFTKGFTNTTGDGWAYDASRIAILKRMADEIHTYKSDALMILEHFADNTEEKELAAYGFLLWGDCKRQYQEASMGYVSDLSEASYIDLSWSVPGIVDYMESHDEERLMYKNIEYGNHTSLYDTRVFETALKRVKLCATFFLSLPGPKMLWQFEELGYDISIDSMGRVGEKPIKWDYYDVASRKNVYDFFSEMIELRKENDVFSTADFTLYESGKLKRLNLKSAEMDVVVLGNFDVASGSIAGNFSRTGKWYEYFYGDSVTVTTATQNMSFTLAAGEYRLFTSKKLPRSSYLTSVNKYPSYDNGDAFTAYPNPFSDETMIMIKSDEQSDRTIEIYAADGRIVSTIIMPSGTFERSWDGCNSNGNKVPPGLYIIRINTGGKYSFGRVIVR